MTGLCGRAQARGTPRLSAKWGDQGARVCGLTVFPGTGGAVPVVATRGRKSASSGPSPGSAPGWAPPGRGDLERLRLRVRLLGLLRGHVPSLRMAEGVHFVNPDASIPRGACHQRGWSLCPVSVAGPGVNAVRPPPLKVTEARAPRIWD